MPKAEFTYEVRRLPMPPVGIEDYVVRTSDGEAVGTVAALLERAGGERLLVVEAGAPPLKSVQRAVHWDAIDRIDHEAVAVWLRLDRAGFERQSLELDPDRAVEEGEGEPEARRIADPPEDLIPPAQEGHIRGPVDRSEWATVAALFVLMGFSVLVATIVVYYTGDNTWGLLYLIPAALAVLTVARGFRLYRNPYEPRSAQKR